MTNRAYTVSTPGRVCNRLQEIASSDQSGARMSLDPWSHVRKTVASYRLPLETIHVNIRRLLRVATFGLVCALPLTTQAGVLKDGYIMCSSRKALDDGIQLTIKGRRDLWESVGCYSTSSRIDGVVMDRGFKTSEVLLRFTSGETARVWVPSEALK